MRYSGGIAVASAQKAHRHRSSAPLPLPQRVVMQLGSPLGDLSPLVGAGERVNGGQKIAVHPDGIYPPVRSSISGTVSKIVPWPSPWGREVLSIAVEGDGESAVETLSEPEPARDDHRLFQLLFDAGIRESDPHTWPLPVRIVRPGLTPPILFPFAPELLRPIEFLIVNGMDRQPGVTLRSQLINERGKDLLETLPVLKRLSGAPRTVLTVYQSQRLPRNFERNVALEGVELIRCPDSYPLALEPILVPHVTGREYAIPPGEPRSVGAAVMDVVAAVRILEALRDGRPATDSFFQLDLPSAGIHEYIRAREGVLLGEVLEHYPNLREGFSKAILGGPFLGYAQHHLNIPISQHIDSILLQAETELTRTASEPCVNCGYCVRACPMRLLPNELSRFCEHGRFPQAEKMDLSRCIECGICAYVCPVRRPMVHLLRFGKQELQASREET